MPLKHQDLFGTGIRVLGPTSYPVRHGEDGNECEHGPPQHCDSFPGTHDYDGSPFWQDSRMSEKFRLSIKPCRQPEPEESANGKRKKMPAGSIPPANAGEFSNQYFRIFPNQFQLGGRPKLLVLPFQIHCSLIQRSRVSSPKEFHRPISNDNLAKVTALHFHPDILQSADRYHPDHQPEDDAPVEELPVSQRPARRLGFWGPGFHAEGDDITSAMPQC